MSNKVKFALFLVFALFTFYQFYTFARLFNNLNNVLSKETNNSTVLYGTSVVDVAVSSSTRFNFDPSILLLVLNIVLWVERPDRVRRVPLILAFIANLAIVIIRVGIAAPELSLAKAALQNNTQNIWELVNLHTKWNAVYLIPATISALIVLSLWIQFFRKRDILEMF